MAVLAVAAAVVAVRSGGSGVAEESERRAAVRDYIAAVNQTHQGFAVELHELNEAFGALKLAGGGTARQSKRLARAESSLRRLRAELAAIPAPPEARRLRLEIVELADLHVALAAEVRLLAMYASSQAAQGQELVEATRLLERDLARATNGAEQYDVLSTFRATLSDLADRLETTEAPSALEPGRVRQLARLRTLAALSGSLGEALRAGDVDRANALFASFGAQTSMARTTRADQAAIRAYNARIAAINKQRTVVASARSRVSALVQ